LCVDACDDAAIHLHPRRNKAYKCDHCGGKPECVRVCELGALKWIDE
jgi:Fe-S-cluster-containing hydrogenase component 2